MNEIKRDLFPYSILFQWDNDHSIYFVLRRFPRDPLGLHRRWDRIMIEGFYILGSIIIIPIYGLSYSTGNKHAGHGVEGWSWIYIISTKIQGKIKIIVYMLLWAKVAHRVLRFFWSKSIRPSSLFFLRPTLHWVAFFLHPSELDRPLGSNQPVASTKQPKRKQMSQGMHRQWRWYGIPFDMPASVHHGHAQHLLQITLKDNFVDSRAESGTEIRRDWGLRWTTRQCYFCIG